MKKITLLFGIIILLGAGCNSNSSKINSQNNGVNNVDEKIPINNEIQHLGFTKYTFPDDGFNIFLPNQPERHELGINSGGINKIKYYSATSNEKFVKYLILISILDDKILSEESVDAFLDNLLKSQLAQHNEPVMIDDQHITFKALKASQYTFSSLNLNGDRIIYKHLSFISKGKPFTLEIIFSDSYESNTYWDEFINSIELQ